MKNPDSFPPTLAEALNEAQNLNASLNSRLSTYRDQSRRLRPDFAKAYDELIARLGILDRGEVGPKVGERHLRHLLKSYHEYGNEARTPLSLHKDAPSLARSKPWAAWWRCPFRADFTTNTSAYEFLTGVRGRFECSRAGTFNPLAGTIENAHSPGATPGLFEIPVSP